MEGEKQAVGVPSGCMRKCAASFCYETRRLFFKGTKELRVSECRRSLG